MRNHAFNTVKERFAEKCRFGFEQCGTFNASAKACFASGSLFKQLLKRTAPVRGNKRKNGSSIGCSHMHGSNRKSDMFPIRRTCEKTRIPCSRRSCFAIAPAKRAGQSAALKMHRRRAGRYTRRISDLLHNPHGTDVQRYRSNPWILHQNCGKRRSAAFP